MDEPWTSRGRAVDEPSTQVSIGKYREGQVSIGKDRREKVETLARELALPHSFIPNLFEWFEYKEARSGEQTESAMKGLMKLFKKNIDLHGEEAVAGLISYSISGSYGSIFFDRLDKERSESGASDQGQHSDGDGQERHGIYIE